MLDIEPVETYDGLETTIKLSGTALIDADTIAFTSCLECETREDCLPREFYSESEWDEIVNHPLYYEPEHAIYSYDEEELLKIAIGRVEEIRHQTSTKDVELYFSGGTNFRHKLTPMYKANRKNFRYPCGLAWLKEELLKHYKGTICTDWEADDMVVYLKRRYPKKYILCAIDKDVLKSVVGHHFDYYHQRMEWTDTDATTAIRWPYIQCLMGDSSDNIQGCKGIGAKRAEKLLGDLCFPDEMWKVVVKTYESKGLTVKDAIETMRLVNMHQLSEINGKLQITLWQPPITTYEGKCNENK